MIKVEVFDKARELGHLLSDTPEYDRLQLARTAYDNDKTIREQQELLAKMADQMDEMMESGDYDQNTLATMRQQLRRVEKEIDAHPLAVELGKAKEDFTAMMQEVNQVVHFVITGELPPTPTHSGCGGCSGCGQVH